MIFLEVQNQGDVATEQILHVWYCCMSQLYIVEPIEALEQRRVSAEQVLNTADYFEGVNSV